LPQKHSLLRSSLLLSASSIGASLLGMLSQMIQARQFGARSEMGEYFAALSVTGVIMGIAPAVFSSAVVPALVGLDSDPLAQRRVVGTLFRSVVIGALLISVGGAAASPWIIKALMNGASSELALTISRILWMTVGFSIIASYLSAVHHASQHFVQVGAIALLPPAAVIISVLVASRSVGVIAVPLGLFAGAMMQLAILLPNSNWSHGSGPETSLVPPVLRRFLRMTPSILLSLLPFTAAPMIAVFWAERIDKSAIPYFGYCQSIATMLSVTVSFGLATASFPDLVRALSNGEHNRFLSAGRTYIKCLFIGAAFLATIVCVARVPMLTLLLKRGQFDAKALQGTASVLPWYLAGMVCVAALNFLRNIYYAAGYHANLGLIGAVAPVVFFASAAFLGRTQGINGIALSYAIGFFVYVALAIALLRLSSATLWSASLGLALLGCLILCLGAAQIAELVDLRLAAVPFWPRSSLTTLTAVVSLCIPAPFLFSREERRALGSSPLLRWLPLMGGNAGGSVA
jgi:putative peptidoglycan lipid II flippase